MTKEYRTRTGTATAIDTKSQLTAVGNETAPGPLLVPIGTQRLTGLIIAAESSYAANDGANALVRLEGSGLLEGPETMAAGGQGTAVATGKVEITSATFVPLDVPVVPANEILIFGEMTGGDTGQISFGVTLIFE